MSRTVIEPLKRLESVLPADPLHPTNEELATVKTGFHELLLEAGCLCVGESVARTVDVNWERDIDFIVNRMAPREKTFTLLSGLAVVATQRLIITSLKAEVDHKGEICCWTYSSEWTEA